MSTYTGSAIAFTVVRDATPAPSYAAQTWKVHTGAPIQVASYTADIRAAGTYTLKIDGVTFATVAGVGAAATGVVFTPAAPVELAAGSHTFELTNASGSVQWYARTTMPTTPTGGGGDRLGWDCWQEPIAGGSTIFPAGSLSYKEADGTLVAGVLHTNVSGGTFVAQTWTVTFDVAVLLTGMTKKLSASDTGYVFSIAGVTRDTVVKASGTALVRHGFVPAAPILLAPGTYTFKVQPSASRSFPYRSSITGQPVGDSHVTGWSGWSESSGNFVNATLFYRLAPPGVPTAVTATPGADHIVLSWGAPASGGAVDHYQVRLDGGTPATATSPHDFTGLAAATGYDLEVRAVGVSGAGDSAWVLVHSETVTPPPPGYYRVELTAGPYSWEASTLDTPEYGVRLPLSWGWSMPDTVDFFPCQPDQTTATFQVFVAVASDASKDLMKGSTVTIRMYVDTDPDALPWQTFDGIVTQLDGTMVPGGFLMTVYATDDTARLGQMVVGYTTDWPQESIGDRVERICTEAGINYDTFALGTGLGGTLAPRALAPIDALTAIRAALKDAANEDDSTNPPVEYYGRHVITYVRDDPDVGWDSTLLADTTVVLQALMRRVPGEWDDDPDQLEFDGCLVDATGSWSKLPGPDGRSWAIVDGTTFGTPSGPPLYRNTSLVDITPDNSGTAATRDNLGESLLPDGSTYMLGWYARELRYQAWARSESADPIADPAGPYLGLGVGLASWAPLLVCIPVVVVDVLPEYDLEDIGYLAGTLTGARLVIPPGGRYYVTLRLRPELLPGMALP